ncbi:DUF1622 domain-containing protein [Streptomyces sp. NPDC006464]|uniref:DUF1622 domain-containing protein n=1 Tax=unclassified Streptomyces TaxID=2593676 RepID=UPI0033BC577B
MTLREALSSESAVREAVGRLVHALAAAGDVMIFAAAVWAFARFATSAVRGRSPVRAFDTPRLGRGRSLVRGLEFPLAGDIPRTAVAPGFTEIGRWAAVRTVLNLFLAREIAQERAEIGPDRGGPSRPGEPTHRAPESSPR